jgi:hypothetical protein
VAEGHILKDTLQANHKSEEATRKHHKAKARSVIKKECGRRPHSKNTLQANQKAEKANRNQHKAKARSVIKKECGRRPHSKKDPAGKSQVGRIKHECGHICIYTYIYIYTFRRAACNYLLRAYGIQLRRPAFCTAAAVQKARRQNLLLTGV